MADSRLGHLMKKAKSIRRKKRHGSISNSSNDDANTISNGRSSHSRGTQATESDDNRSINIITPVPSRENDDEAPTRVSYESEDGPDLSSIRPSPIYNHLSQIGYLTTNSPLIQADYYQSSQPSQDSATTDQLGEPDPSGSPNPVGLVPPVSRSSRRSPSPVGRFRNAFKSKKSFSKLSGGGSASSSPERRPATADSKPPSDNITDAAKFPEPSTTEPPTIPKPELKNAVVEDNTELNHGPSQPSRRRTLSKGQTIDTSTPPATPSASENSPPVIVNTPPTPTNASQPRFESPRKSNGLAEGAMITQRRGRSGSTSIVPSKLSTISSAPLTPTPEIGAPTPGNPSPGFFGSMLSAAQNAANTLSNTIANTNISPGPKHKISAPGPTAENSKVADDKVEVEPSPEATSHTLMESKEPAVKTLGMGDLSLSHLGIGEPISRSTTPTKPNFPEGSGVSRGRSDSAPVDVSPAVTSVEAPWDNAQRPQSLNEPPALGEKTPPVDSAHEEGTSIHRSGSVRSALGRRTRKRGSTNGTGGTGGTGNTIGAAIASANASLAQPSANPSVPKLTGFAVASKKRNRDFHSLFKSVPDDDYLIEDYSCALQREILAHGRLYVSEGHLCFSSNILGWITTLVMSFDEIVSVEKRSTALLFKNGLMVSTLHAKHIFASFTSRDSTYDLIVKIWKLGHPGLTSSLNGVRLEDTGGDKTERIGAESVLGGSQSASGSEGDESDDEEDVYDEDEEEESGLQPSEGQSTEAALLESAIEKSVTRKPSGAVTGSIVPADKPKDAPAAPSGVQDFPGPAAHAPTDCGDADTHFKKIVGDDVVPAPLGKVFDMLFGPTSVTWMAKWITVDQKCLDLQMEDKVGLGQDNRTRTFTYIKPLNGSIGPKQTKCIVTENIENFDLEKAVNILVSTQNPDVPSGNIFSVKTKYCLTWAENNATRVQINCVIEWTGKSWLRGPIENGANEGQTQYCKDLFVALKGAVSSKRPAALTNGAAAKGRKKGKKGKTAAAANVTSDTEEVTKTSKQDWGMLEPLHAVLGPVVDIGKPLLTGNVVYGLLVGLLVASWFRFGFTNRPVAGPYGSELGFYGHPDRLAAYEEIWRREESELWEWLEERVGMDRLHSGELHTRKRVMEPRTVQEKLREDRMDDRDIREAIRITEEKLKVLKSVVEKTSQ